MNAIVNVDAGWGIGRDGDLIFPIPEDMRFFRQTTTGKIVVMGRRTLQSFPGGKPLKNRVNIVLTRDKGFAAEGAIICHSLNELQAALTPYAAEDVFVVGGEAVYRQLIDHCSTAYVTKVHGTAPADNHFPNLDEMPNWRLVQQSEVQHSGGVDFSFCTYQNRQPLPLGGTE